MRAIAVSDFERELEEKLCQQVEEVQKAGKPITAIYMKAVDLTKKIINISIERDGSFLYITLTYGQLLGIIGAIITPIILFIIDALLTKWGIVG